ncbi:MAG: UbiX family flavin prenyltransferase [Gammaproteobacteria bacterium]|nr:MAG: UbiX family flavin prenyltransferase [Gammaproteobacteria bacterium]
MALALTGASGAAYGLRLLECLLAAGEEVWLLYSKAAQVVLKMEAGLALPARPREAQALLAGRYGAGPGRLRVFGREEWTAPLASGSAAPRAMVVCPATVGTVAAIAHGHSKDLLERAADVVLKEGRRLILVPREMPLSAIHLENLLRLARLGAVIMPACPGFYHRPARVEDLVDFVVARILDQLGVPHRLLPPWGLEAEEGEGAREGPREDPGEDPGSSL